ncbi:hypothetical protein FGO68_gene7271 [Halteria grandinella]|uniref:Secreted protein n=1 Tax=Halteria grandinella TaxID=5974 RepID=A0A8J8T6H7_HALGN|nr:hypothetical protein FGO68_gene7271 [Halteria grandinella]
MGWPYSFCLMSSLMKCSLLSLDSSWFSISYSFDKRPFAASPSIFSPASTTRMAGVSTFKPDTALSFSYALWFVHSWSIVLRSKPINIRCSRLCGPLKRVPSLVPVGAPYKRYG